MYTALTIAGSDSSGGAGIQADLKTMTVNGVFATSAVTALTAQNTMGVTGILNVTPDFLKAEISAVFDDIRPDAVKIGMVSASELIDAIADCLTSYKARNIVVDPVMVATSGARLIEESAVETLKKRLLPIASVITPNIPEAEILSGMSINSETDMENAAAIINMSYGCMVLLKGGHNINDANDLLFDGNRNIWFKGRRINNPNTHGTGCTLSSAIAANLAKGFDMESSIRRAKDYISGALGAMLDLGHGSGPMDHAFDVKGRFTELPSDTINSACGTVKAVSGAKAPASNTAEKVPGLTLVSDMAKRSWDGLSESTVTMRLINAARDIWNGYYSHPFVRGIADGTLDEDKFKFYMIQDYLYLTDYAKVFSLGVVKSRDKALMLDFCGNVNTILNGEMDIHRSYMRRLGISPEEAETSKASLDNISYTSYMLKVAYDDGPAEIIAAILSCALSYEAIARRIAAENPAAPEHPFFGEWIRGYMSEDYQGGNISLIELMERLSEGFSENEIRHLEDVFVNCSRYEADFWDMAWEMRL